MTKMGEMTNACEIEVIAKIENKIKKRKKKQNHVLYISCNWHQPQHTRISNLYKIKAF